MQATVIKQTLELSQEDSSMNGVILEMLNTFSLKKLFG